MGMDATNKMPGETDREWGEPIVMDPNVTAKIDTLWDELGIDALIPATRPYTHTTKKN